MSRTQREWTYVVLIGIFQILSGSLSLVLNEFTMQMRRVWPWRRDDSNPEREQQLNEYYRLSVYLGSIASIELGAFLAEVHPSPWPLRLLIYFGFGAWLLWRRPMLRCGQFWFNFHRRGIDDPS